MVQKSPKPSTWDEHPQTLRKSMGQNLPTSTGDRHCVLGGDSVLTEHGEEYASALAEWVDKKAGLDGFLEGSIG